jgi:integration host factor subunit alpha
MSKPGTLTKAHIVDAVAEKNGFTRKKSIETVEILLELIKQSLESGDDLLISGFGKFSVKQKAKRKGRNPATGKDIVLAPRKVITFKWSEKLKEKLNTKPKTKAKKRRVTSKKK